MRSDGSSGAGLGSGLSGGCLRVTLVMSRHRAPERYVLICRQYCAAFQQNPLSVNFSQRHTLDVLWESQAQAIGGYAGKLLKIGVSLDDKAVHSESIPCCRSRAWCPGLRVSAGVVKCQQTPLIGQPPILGTPIHNLASHEIRAW